MTPPTMSAAPGHPPTSRASATTTRFHRRVLAALNEAAIPFLVGGGHALERYLGIGRSVRDLDLFMRERDVSGTLHLIEELLGYRGEMTFPHWLAKIKRSGEDCIDVIFNSGNAVCAVDDDW